MCFRQRENVNSFSASSSAVWRFASDIKNPFFISRGTVAATEKDLIFPGSRPLKRSPGRRTFFCQ